MESKIARPLSLMLAAAVVFLAVADVCIIGTAPWWLSSIYSGAFGEFRIMLGYNYAQSGMIYPLMLAFFIVSGLLCLGILWDAFCLLTRILRGSAFCRENAHSLLQAACFGVGLAGVFFAKMFFSPSILTMVCGGIFFLYALFMLVLSELFRLAAHIREENELTI